MSQDDLEARVREADVDRWLASRLATDPARRGELIALYAFEAELAAIPTRVSQPLLAELRFTWWRDQLDELFEARSRKGHPVLEALAPVIERAGLDRGAFEALIEAHIGRVRREPHDLDALFVGPMQAAVRILAGPGHEATVADAARVRGLILTGRSDEGHALRPAANRALGSLPPTGFPAVAVAAVRDPEAPEPLKRLRLVWAAFRGRI